MAFRLVAKRLLLPTATAISKNTSTAVLAASATCINANTTTTTTTRRWMGGGHRDHHGDGEIPQLGSVKDLIISLTFVDPSGARRVVPGVVGKTLHEMCMIHDIDVGPASMCGPVEKKHSEDFTEPLFGEGPSSAFDHVVLAGNGVETAIPKSEVEDFMLDQYWKPEDLYPESRLASVITLTKEMDGMIVFIPDRLEDEIP